MTSFNSIVGNRIQKCLVEIGCSQSHLAEELNVSRQVVNKIIHGRKNINLEEIKLIADILGISLKKLVQDENEIEEDPIIAFIEEVDTQEAKDGLNKAKEIMDLIIFHRDINESHQEIFD
ncbi:MAG: helix-turn-helix domain-containing protein [Bacillota bacterium]